MFILPQALSAHKGKNLCKCEKNLNLHCRSEQTGFKYAWVQEGHKSSFYVELNGLVQCLHIELFL